MHYGRVVGDRNRIIREKARNERADPSNQLFYIVTHVLIVNIVHVGPVKYKNYIRQYQLYKLKK